MVCGGGGRERRSSVKRHVVGSVINVIIMRDWFEIGELTFTARETKSAASCAQGALEQIVAVAAHDLGP